MSTRNLRTITIALAAVVLLFQGSAIGQSPNIVREVTMSPSTPNIIRFGDTVWVSFHYDTTEPGGVRIWARPITVDANGDDMPTPNYGACGSPLYPVGSGVGTNCFTISSGNVTVDKIRCQMYDASGTTLLFNAKVVVHYKFR